MATFNFPATSRYYGIETTALTTVDGRVVVYLKRRFVPSPLRFARVGPPSPTSTSTRSPSNVPDAPPASIGSFSFAGAAMIGRPLEDQRSQQPSRISGRQRVCLVSNRSPNSLAHR